MQTHLVFVTNSLRFQDQIRAKRLGIQFPICDFSPSKKLKTPNCFVSLVNTTDEETLRVKHMQLNTVMCDSWRKKRVTPSPSVTFQLKLFCSAFRFIYCTARNVQEIERRSKNCITSRHDDKLQILFSVRAEIDRVTPGTSDALWSVYVGYLCCIKMLSALTYSADKISAHTE